MKSFIINVSATFNTELLNNGFELFSPLLPNKPILNLLEYNSVFRTLYHSNLQSSENRACLNVYLIRLEDSFRLLKDSMDKQPEYLMKLYTSELINALSENSDKTPILLIIVSPSQKILNHEKLTKCHHTCVKKIKNSVKNKLNLIVLEYSFIENKYGLSGQTNEFLDTLSHVPYTNDYYLALSREIARHYYHQVMPKPKVIVLDADNTLWEGVIGEDGKREIKISPARKKFHQQLLARKENGLLLCIISKNDESDVMDALNHLLIQQNDLVSWKINWQDKSINIQSLAKELNLSLNSFVFIDDNPIECALMREQCPEVITLQMPTKEKEIAIFIDELWILDKTIVTDEDKNRTQMVKENLIRELVLKKSRSFIEYLNTLDMKIDIHAMTDIELPRVAQLTTRTNQFNSSSIRRSPIEIQELLSLNYKIFTVSVEDKYGDYGLVGVFIVQPQTNYLYVDTLLLSCRILGRGIEYEIMHEIAKIAKEFLLSKVKINYCKTPKNEPIKRFINDLNRQCKEKNNNDIFLSQKLARVQLISNTLVENIKSIDHKKVFVSHNQEDISKLQMDLFEKLRTIMQMKQRLPKQLRKKLLYNMHNPFQRPNFEIERTLTAILKKILRLDDIGIYDNFFDLGATSLTAMQIISEIRRKYKLELSINDIFNYNSVFKLSNKINFGKFYSILPEINTISRQQDIPVSFAQARLLFLYELQPDNIAYNIPIALQLNKKIKDEDIKHALQYIVNRHEALRTIFVNRNGTTYQVLLENHDLDFTSLDLSNSPEVILETIHHALKKPFCLKTGPLIKTIFIKVSSDKNILFINMHHIISDGWSCTVLIKELKSILNAFIKNQQPILPHLKIQYADYTLWQRSWLQGATLKKLLNYWEKNLKHYPGYIDLPLDFSRPQVQTYNGKTINHIVLSDVKNVFKPFCKEHQVTSFMVLLGAINVLLYQYSNQKDLVVGTPIANRQDSDIEELIGFFVNTVPLRTKINVKKNFISLLRQIKQTTLSAYIHQHLPFEKILEISNVAYNRSYNPIFQVMLIFQNFTDDINSIDIEPYPIEPVGAKFDLTFEFIEFNNLIQLRIEYNTDLYLEDSIVRMAQHFERILHTLINKPFQSLNHIDYLTELEKQRFLIELNDTNMIFSSEKTAIELFEQQVLQTPHKTAIVFKNQKISYLSLNNSANQLARYLIDKAVKPQSIIGIYIERSFDMIIGILGILKAGAIYVPIDCKYTIQRIKFIIRDSDCKIIVSQYKMKNKLNQCLEHSRTILFTDNKLLNTYPQQNLNITTKLSDPMYIVYTSGTTGNPKGVIGTHQGIMNRLYWGWEQLPFELDDICCIKTAFGFIDHVCEIFSPLLKGIKIVIYPETQKEFYLDNLFDCIDQYKITRILFVPLILNLISKNQTFIEKSSSLKHIFISGDLFSIDIINHLKQTLPSVQLHNFYGSTEVSADIAYYKILETIDQKFIPIGKPISNNKLYILNQDLQLRPINVIGELYVSGKGLASGYLNNPSLTHDKFIKNPFSNDRLDRLFKTGDLCRYLPDGNIECLGRVDSQVKIGGIRIECGEIEQIILKNNAIKNAIVISHVDQYQNNRLVVYLLPMKLSVLASKISQNILIKEISDHLKQYLPDDIRPSNFIFLSHLPITFNGKLDKKALPPPIQINRYIVNKYVHPRNEIDEIFIQIWSDVLKIKKIGITDNFFDLGGNSLLAVNLLVLIKDQFHIDLELKQLFEYPSIKELTTFLNLNATKRRDD